MNKIRETLRTFICRISTDFAAFLFIIIFPCMYESHMTVLYVSLTFLLSHFKLWWSTNFSRHPHFKVPELLVAYSINTKVLGIKRRYFTFSLWEDKQVRNINRFYHLDTMALLLSVIQLQIMTDFKPCWTDAAHVFMPKPRAFLNWRFFSQHLHI